MKKQEREVKKKSSPKKGKSVKGVVTARQCEVCGHHEIGIITEESEYLPLRPGMRVEVIGE
ncbi:MAG: hypothetical protein ABSE95_07240 [Thermodesulfobacteriota bacterium]|jgi:dihydrodipicolinate reductase